MSIHAYIPAKACCMVMRINLDCNSCCRKARRIILSMKEIETHMISKQESRVVVCGRFTAADVAIKLRKKMKRRVEILEIQDFPDAADSHN
ncbi:Copper transport protein family [Euphorbia peplus]|nr:Copper transport protein family [Euphorbia peplus]